MALAALEDGLSARGLLDQSLLGLTADHGETLGDRDSGIFGHGNDLPQEQLRIPLLMKNPQLTPEVLDCVASNMDTMPTLIRMMGWEAHVEAQGLALQDGCRSITHSELYGNDGSLSYISAANKNYRLVRACNDGTEIAYNLETNQDGSQLMDPNSVPEIDSLRLSLDTYGDAIQAATGSGCVSLY
jgi:membrane-anchored protein YejM (alkaline phosphatase superfamily)